MSDSIKRPPGCLCHWEVGDSSCPVHPPDAAELAYARSIGAPYRLNDVARKAKP